MCTTIHKTKQANKPRLIDCQSAADWTSYKEAFEALSVNTIPIASKLKEASSLSNTSRSKRSTGISKDNNLSHQALLEPTAIQSL